MNPTGLGAGSGGGPVRQRADVLVNVSVGEGDARAQRHGNHAIRGCPVGGRQDHLAQRFLVPGQVGRAGESEGPAAGVVVRRDRPGVSGQGQRIARLFSGHDLHRGSRQADRGTPKDLQPRIHCGKVGSGRLVGHAGRSRGQLQGERRRLAHHHRAHRLAEVASRILNRVRQGVTSGRRCVHATGYQNAIRQDPVGRIQGGSAQIGEGVAHVEQNRAGSVQSDHGVCLIPNHGQLPDHRLGGIVELIPRLGGGNPHGAGAEEADQASIDRGHGRIRGGKQGVQAGAGGRHQVERGSRGESRSRNCEGDGLIQFACLLGRLGGGGDIVGATHAELPTVVQTGSRQGPGVIKSKGLIAATRDLFRPVQRRNFGRFEDSVRGNGRGVAQAELTVIVISPGIDLAIGGNGMGPVQSGHQLADRRRSTRERKLGRSAHQGGGGRQASLSEDVGTAGIHLPGLGPD